MQRVIMKFHMHAADSYGIPAGFVNSIQISAASDYIPRVCEPICAGDIVQYGSGIVAAMVVWGTWAV